jgi:hypothetical protein
LRLFDVSMELGALMITGLATALLFVGAQLGLQMTFHSLQPKALMRVHLYLLGGISKHWFVERCVQTAR